MEAKYRCLGIIIFIGIETMLRKIIDMQFLIFYYIFRVPPAYHYIEDCLNEKKLEF